MFNPSLTTTLEIGGVTYRFSPHPVVPSMVWGQEGRHAVVYRLQPEYGGMAYALKVFREAFRHDGLLGAADSLNLYSSLPGMRVCEQIVLTPERHGALINQYEDLNYAMMMPWIEGNTWFDLLQMRKNLSLDQSRALAESMAWVLYALEINYLAHCDLSSGNVIIDPDFVQVDLIDVEDLYTPWVDPPPFVSIGSVGYQHDSVAQTGQWSPSGDRFAGAVLIAEMLGWAHAEVRKAAYGESFFAPDELQQNTERYHLLRDVLRQFDAGFAEAFEQAWRSRSLTECPPLRTWYDLLDALPREPVKEWAPIDLEAFGVDKVIAPAPNIAAGLPGYEIKPAPVQQPTPNQAPPPKQPSNRQQSPNPFWKQGCRTVIFVIAMSSFLCCFATVFFWGLSFFSG